jgi:hypothetical protein
MTTRMVPGSSNDERTLALREVGRAIALTPDHPEALARLVRLLTEPPKVPPPEVLAAAHALTRSGGAESVDPGLPARK